MNFRVKSQILVIYQAVVLLHAVCHSSVATTANLFPSICQKGFSVSGLPLITEDSLVMREA